MKPSDHEQEISCLGIGLISLFVLLLCIASSRLFDFTEGGSVQLFTEKIVEGGDRLLRFKIGRLFYFFMFMAYFIGMLFQVGVILSTRKLKKRKWYMGILLMAAAIIYVGYDQWVCNGGARLFNWLWREEWVATSISHYCWSIERVMIWTFNPVTFLIALLFIENVREKTEGNAIALLKEAGITLCITGMGGLIQMANSQFVRSVFYPLRRLMAFTPSRQIPYDFKYQFSIMGIITFIFGAGMILALFGLLALVKQGKIRWDDHRGERVLDTVFLAVIVFASCYYLQKDNEILPSEVVTGKLSTTFIVMGLIPIYLSIKALLFHKWLHLRKLTKEDILPLGLVIVLFVLAGLLMIKTKPERLLFISQQLHSYRVYIGLTGLLGVAYLIMALKKDESMQTVQSEEKIGQ